MYLLEPIHAFLDDYDVVNYYVKKNFYSGELGKPMFEGNETFELTNTTEFNDYNVYTLKFEKNFSVEIRNTVLDYRGSIIDVIPREIVRTERFDEEFYYDGNDLGVTYSKNETMWKVWAPTALAVNLALRKQSYRMHREENGVWTLKLRGDFEGTEYTYMVKHQNMWNTALDPYGLASTANSEKSVVVDVKKIKRANLNLDKRASHDHAVDAIIYELSVRDFTNNDHTVNKGKFIGVVEETNLNYLKSLGVTHIQLLPIFDFGGVDELKPWELYNWGYNPIQFNVPEGSYATDPNEPYSRIFELQEMISKIHESGLRVNMDVVYNHVYSNVNFSWNNIVPGYFSQYKNAHEQTETTGCGNDTATYRKMVNKYIVDSCVMWEEIYGIDGFRVDLMGIHHIDNINAIRNAIAKDAMLYGEGWHMITTMSEEVMASQKNQGKMNCVGHFNDGFRDIIRTREWGGVVELGLLNGKKVDTNDLKAIILGSCLIGTSDRAIFDNPGKSINYVECHDDATVFDIVKQYDNKISDNEIKKRALFATKLVLISQGVPFLHAGQEFFRTKDGVHNSHRDSDVINRFDWMRLNENIDSIDELRELILMRKQFKTLRLRTAKDIKEEISFKEISDGVLRYSSSEFSFIIDTNNFTVLTEDK